MNAAGQLAVREDAALNLLKTKLGAGGSASGASQNGNNSNNNNNITPALQAMVDVYLLRFMRNKKLNIEETMDKLRRRRDFERSLPALTISPSCVRALRSGAFNLIGVDVMRRPVLYIRLNVFRSVTEPEEMEKLAIVLLEYMQGVAMNCQGGQEMVVLVGQQESTWYQSQGVGSLQSELLITLLTKYYPDLVGLVLMVDAPWATRQRVKTALSNAASSSRARNLFQIVSKADLQRFMDVSILPEDLGGRHPTGSAHDFSESVLRHWYATVALINQEIVSGSARALYIPTAAVVGGGAGGGGLAHHSTSRACSVGNGPSSLNSSQSHRVPQKSSSALTPRRSRVGHQNSNNADTVTDDGMCSVISDTDVDLEEDDGTDAMSLGPAAGAATNNAAVSGAEVTVSNKGLHHDLRVERDRRMALEHELTRLRLGITLDPSMVTQLECALRQVHEEINVVVAEVITRTKASTQQPSTAGTPPRRGAATAAAGSRNSKTGPSLHQLIETTDAQLLKIVQERQHVGAMKFATPPPDRKKGRGACSVM